MNYLNKKIFSSKLRKEQKSEELKNWGISNIISNHIIFYPTSVTLTYFWGLGSLSGIFLGIQILSGVFLAMHYQVGVESAFHSVEDQKDPQKFKERGIIKV